MTEGAELGLTALEDEEGSKGNEAWFGQRYTVTICPGRNGLLAETEERIVGLNKANETIKGPGHKKGQIQHSYFVDTF